MKFTTITILLTVAVLSILPVGCVSAQRQNVSAVSELCHMPKAPLQTLWLTGENPQGIKGGAGKTRFGRKGAPVQGIPAGGQLVLADIKTSGTIRRIWCTITSFIVPEQIPVALRGLKIEMYWDGAKTPAVQAPLGDFFCHSMGNMVSFENACFSSPKATSFNCFIPMPFRKSAKIVVINETEHDIGMFYEVDCTTGDKHDDSLLYFHAYWRREHYTKLREDFTILPTVKGKGRYLGCNLGFQTHPWMRQSWWGEGEVKIYLDGDKEYPTLCGTGTEDYIGSGFGQDYFSHQYQGNQYLSEKGGYYREAYGFYRFHIPDPVYFYKDIRATIQVIGGPGYPDMLQMLNEHPEIKLMKAGDGTEYYTRKELEDNPKHSGYVERMDDWCATAYWFMEAPENDLPPLAPIDERTKNLP